QRLPRSSHLLLCLRSPFSPTPSFDVRGFTSYSGEDNTSKEGLVIFLRSRACFPSVATTKLLTSPADERTRHTTSAAGANRSDDHTAVRAEANLLWLQGSAASAGDEVHRKERSNGNPKPGRIAQAHRGRRRERRLQGALLRQV
ncbi:unnamed protein product, partial [Ectocarpus fasciculatus]